MPLESAAVQLGCSEFIFEFLLEPFLARDTGWTVAAGRFWCDHNLESLPPARPLCPPTTLTWGPSREVELPHQFSSLRTPRFDSAPAPLSSGPSRVTIPSITPCVLSLPSSPRNFARSLDPFPCLLSLRSPTTPAGERCSPAVRAGGGWTTRVLVPWPCRSELWS